MLIDLLESSKAIGLCPMGIQQFRQILLSYSYLNKVCMIKKYFAGNLRSETLNTSSILIIRAGHL